MVLSYMVNNPVPKTARHANKQLSNLRMRKHEPGTHWNHHNKMIPMDSHLNGNRGTKSTHLENKASEAVK